MSTEKTNHEGYDDPTAYMALTHIEQTERKIKNRHQRMVFICSPLAGNVRWNIRNARRYSLYAIEQGVVPVAPHLLYTQFLDDTDPEHRSMGMQCGLTLLRHCRELWAFGGQASKGMIDGIAFARKHGIVVRFFDGGCEEVPPFA